MYSGVQYRRSLYSTSTMLNVLVCIFQCSSGLTDRIFSVLQVSREDGIDEEGFEAAAVILLAALSERNLAFMCRSENQMTPYDEHLSTLMSRKGTPERITKEEMKLLLDTLGEHYTPQTVGKVQYCVVQVHPKQLPLELFVKIHSKHGK